MYLDDWLIHEITRDLTRTSTEEVIWVAQKLGIRLNVEKSELIPSQKMTYLGVIFDRFSTKPFSVREENKQVPLPLSDIHTESEPTGKKLVGDLGTYGVPRETHSTIENEIPIITIQLARGVDPTQRFTLAIRPDPSNMMEDLDWWAHREHLEVGLELTELIPHFHLYTDASLQGWGAHTAHL